MPQSQNVIENQPQGQWGENRLADVVKGTAKTKCNSKDNSNDNESPRATSPQQQQQHCSTQSNQTTPFRQISAPVQETKDVSTDSGNIQLSTVTLTPPTSPEKYDI